MPLSPPRLLARALPQVEPRVEPQMFPHAKVLRIAANWGAALHTQPQGEFRTRRL